MLVHSLAEGLSPSSTDTYLIVAATPYSPRNGQFFLHNMLQKVLDHVHVVHHVVQPPARDRQ